MALWWRRALFLCWAVLGCAAALQAGCGSKGGQVVNRIAVVASDGAVYTMAPDGGDRQRVSPPPVMVVEPPGPATTAPAAASTARPPQPRYVLAWPTWSPDARRLAYFSFDTQSGEDSVNATYVATLDGTAPIPLHQAQAGGPIYLSWAPDSASLALLVQEGGGLTLLGLDARGTSRATLARGNPLYWSWSPDGSTILAHVGSRADGTGRLFFVSPRSPALSRQDLTVEPSDFRAPAWSPTGKHFAYAAQEAGASTLYVAPVGTTTPPVRIGRADAFTWSPDGRRLAHAPATGAGGAVLSGIWASDADGKAQAQLVAEPVLAFFWAPDSQRLAYLGIDEAREALVLGVVSAAQPAEAPKRVATFTPTRDFMLLLNFFDQYAQSTTFWSPDGRSLVYSAASRHPANGASDSGDQIYVVPADGSAPPRAIAAGRIAFWSPR